MNDNDKQERLSRLSEQEQSSLQLADNIVQYYLHAKNTGNTSAMLALHTDTVQYLVANGQCAADCMALAKQANKTLDRTKFVTLAQFLQFNARLANKPLLIDHFVIAKVLRMLVACIRRLALDNNKLYEQCHKQTQELKDLRSQVTKLRAEVAVAKFKIDRQNSKSIGKMHTSERTSGITVQKLAGESAPASVLVMFGGGIYTRVASMTVQFNDIHKYKALVLKQLKQQLSVGANDTNCKQTETEGIDVCLMFDNVDSVDIVMQALQYIRDKLVKANVDSQK